jgi:hypothetical protein
MKKESVIDVKHKKKNVSRRTWEIDYACFSSLRTILCCTIRRIDKVSVFPLETPL